MEQSIIIKNITGTAFVVGMALSTMSFNNTNAPVDLKTQLLPLHELRTDYDYSNTSSALINEHSIYSSYENENRLMDEAEMLFGKMRPATDEELASVNNYIYSISKETGVDFFDLC